MEQKEPGFRWDYAVTSEIDRVFTSVNVTSYWKKEKNTRQIILPYPHYLFYKWDSFTDFIKFVEKHKKKQPNTRKVQNIIKGF
jgi:hypothetical protein